MRILLFCLTAVVLLFSPTAKAYKLTGQRWADSQMPLKWQLDPNGVDNITTKADTDEVKRAVQTWSDVACSKLTFAAPTNLTGARNADGEGINKVYWVESRWTYGSGTLGVTTPKYYGGGALFDADIEFNGQDYDWTTGSGNYCNNCVDVFSIAVHEFGHFFGLDHSTSNAAVMFASYPGSPKQALSADDIAGICALYPAAQAGTGVQGASCAQTADCQSNLVCAAPKGGSGGVCTVTCTGPTARTCPTDTTCQAATTGYACFGDTSPGGGDPGGEGQSCGNSMCEGGLICVGSSQVDGRCRRTCTPNQANSCPQYFSCTPLQGGTGACMPSGNQPPPGAAECAQCGRNTPCGAGLTCAVDTDGMSRCRQPCVEDDACGTTERCVARNGIPGASAVCACPGLDPRLEGEGCARSSECAENSICINDGTAGGAVCRTSCDPQASTCVDPKGCFAVGAAFVCKHPPVDTETPDERAPPEGCGCAAPVGIGWMAAFALMLRRRRR